MLKWDPVSVINSYLSGPRSAIDSLEKKLNCFPISHSEKLAKVKTDLSFECILLSSLRYFLLKIFPINKYLRLLNGQQNIHTSLFISFLIMNNECEKANCPNQM